MSLSVNTFIISKSLPQKRIKDILLSPLLYSLILIAGTITASILLQGYYRDLLLSTIAILGVITVLFITRNAKKIIYEITLIKNIFFHSIGRYHWWDQITENIYLGGIPLENQNHHVLLGQLNITHYISLVEKFEYEGGLLSSPLKYNKKNPKILHLPTADFQGSSVNDLRKGVVWMQKAISEGGTCYIHCKAGKGRSAILVACYLFEFVYNHNSHRAMADLKKKRNIKLNKNQQECYLSYCKAYTPSTHPRP